MIKELAERGLVDGAGQSEGAVFVEARVGTLLDDLVDHAIRRAGVEPEQRRVIAGDQGDVGDAAEIEDGDWEIELRVANQGRMIDRRERGALAARGDVIC